jgi:hypothetical protein
VELLPWACSLNSAQGTRGVREFETKLRHLVLAESFEYPIESYLTVLSRLRGLQTIFLEPPELALFWDWFGVTAGDAKQRIMEIRKGLREVWTKQWGKDAKIPDTEFVPRTGISDKSFELERCERLDTD